MNPAATQESRREAAPLSTTDFHKLQQLIYEECGINLAPGKRIMVEARLRKRLKPLGIPSLHEYCGYLFSEAGRRAELVQMIDVITTNKTDFFRERAHFDYLVRETLPLLERSTGAGVGRPCAFWSAGCSTGEEPYSLAMVLSDYSRGHEGPAWSYSILATDISTRVLERAKEGIYNEDLAAPIPADCRRRYLLRSKDPSKPLVRIVPELRSKIQFRRLNFMDADFGIGDPLDVVFCRNVIIYFDREIQERVVGAIVRRLRPGGYLFMGHSETLNGLDLPLKPVAATVYRRLA
jgi:chemotaxis protein methyltransferase CheR